MEQRFHVVFLLSDTPIFSNSPETLEEVFLAWHEKMADKLSLQDIQAARLLVEKI